MTSCLNCGHESHCGQMLKKTFPPHTEGESIEVCRFCRCELCDEKTKS